MSITGLMRRLSLIGIDAILQLSLGCLLMRTITSFLRYTGNLNFINSPISRVILVNLQLSLGCLLMRTITSFLRYTGNLNFINSPISRVILVNLQLLSCLFF